MNCEHKTIAVPTARKNILPLQPGDVPTTWAATAQSSGAALIHISTDYVFNGEGRRPYGEDDPVDPIGVYGKSKEAGESAIRQIVSSHVIIRTSWLYGKYGKNFVYTMLRLFHEKDSIGVVADQQGTPTWTKDLAGFIKTIISGSRQLAESTYGTYHYSGEGETSWYDFAEEIYAFGRENGIVQRACEINPLTTEQYPTKSKRPKYSVFDKAVARAGFGGFRFS